MDNPASQDALKEDWDTIWQSEAAALAADREVQELWAAGMAHQAAQEALWAAVWAGLARSGRDGPSGCTRSHAAPGSPPASPAPPAVEALERRIAELERRLAGRDG